MARKGLPKKYAKHGFKKGWKLYKAAQRKSKVSGRAAKPAKPRKRKATTSTGASTMPKKKKSTGRRVVYRTVKAPRKRSRVGRRMPRLLSPQTLNIVIDGTLMGGGAIGSTVAINKLPFVKDLNQYFKAAIQTALGMVLMTFFKDKYIKKASMGIVIGSAISLTLPLLPEGMKVWGRRRRFSPSELYKLQTLGRPVSIGKPRSLGRPVSVSNAEIDNPMMGRTSNRSSRYR